MKDTRLPKLKQLGSNARSRRFLSHLRIAHALMLVLSLALMWKMVSRRELLVGTEILASIPPIERNKSLFYVTTHLSPSHYEFFQKCWPSLLAKSPLYKESDFLIFVSRSNASIIDWSVLNATFANATYAVQVMDNPGYQEGAMLALTEAFSKHWFDGYEWVIRVNPDVLIRNDTFLRKSMQDSSIKGIFADCFETPCATGTNCTNRVIHTDFFAIRPEAVSEQAVLEARSKHRNAELMATQAFSSIVLAGADSWVPNVGPLGKECRVRGVASPVMHTHNQRQIHPQCLSWYD